MRYLLDSAYRGSLVASALHPLPVLNAMTDSGPRIIRIHADESCLGNQHQDRDRPGGAAGLVEYWTGSEWARREYWISEASTTNNRMALRSAIEPLNALKSPCVVEFISDSQYLVRGMNEWLRGWKARGWARKGGAIENVDLWKALDLAAARHDVRWIWVRGHDGNPRNEFANDLAVAAARNQTSSEGLVPSSFTTWLEGERTRRGRYLDLQENAPPGPPQEPASGRSAR
jgi:ribonuclease HI